MTRVTKKTFLKYSGLFLLMAGIIFIPVLYRGNTFIHQGDGFHQHYPFFRQYLNMIRSFFQTGDWQQWDWSIGLGQDTLLTYGYYVVGDPFVYLGLLFPKGAEELAFHAVMFVRIWAVGASILLYAKKMRFSEMSALIASVLYAFSHYTIYNVVRHPFFIHPLIFLPLIVLGIEKIFAKESGAFFAVVIGLAAISNFYFFYMLTILAVLYALLRYPDYKKGWPILGQWFLKFLGLYIVGLLISAVVFLPQVYGFLSASRSPNFPPISLFIYPLNYYALLLVNAITPGTIFWTVGGLSVVAVLSVPFLVRKRREIPSLFWGIIILLVMLVFPFFGSIMNGLSAPYNRFSFVFPFVFVMALVYFLEHFDEIKPQDLKWMKWLMLFFTLGYGVLTFVTHDYFLYLTPIVVGWGTFYVWTSAYGDVLKPKTVRLLLLGLVMMNMSMSALNFYFPIGKNAITGTEKYGTIDDAYENVFAGVEKNLPEDEWYRVGVSSNDPHVRNQYAWLDINGMNSYASITNGAVSDFAQFIENSEYQIIQPLRSGIDDRRIANQVMGVRYILTDVENLDYLPSSYTVNEELSDFEAGMLVAETDNARPFAYVETDYVLTEEIDKMHPVQRESMLERAVFLTEPQANMQKLLISPAFISHQGFCETFEGIELESKAVLNKSIAFTVNEKDSTLVLQFENPEAFINQEVFLYVEGITYTPPETFPGARVNTGYTMRTYFNGLEKATTQVNQYSFSSYFERENMLVHLNEVTEPQLSMGLQFNRVGHYEFEKISVVSRPYLPAQSSSYANRKQQMGMAIETFSDEYIKGTVDSEGGMLVTSMPLSSGWSVIVDGEEVDIETVNMSFIGVPLEAGQHVIEFVYETPYLKLGFILTVIGLASISIYHYSFRKLH